MHFRRELKTTDIEVIREILDSTGFFYDYEVDIALELATANLEKGPLDSGYSFVMVEVAGIPVAFACYGKTPCTADSYDLYWIAVHQNQKGQGIGKQLMHWVVQSIAEESGKNIWIETSSRELYEATRQFYLKMGCTIVAELPNFYGENDNKVVF
ncbi:MAG: GNAT family N-acetyltransferase [Cyclobacteriaceae bacterium]|nr:GNAT family N-acetyltransferase [Cyclobacteriaceae bacterium]